MFNLNCWGRMRSMQAKSVQSGYLPFQCFALLIVSLMLSLVSFSPAAAQPQSMQNQNSVATSQPYPPLSSLLLKARQQLDNNRPNVALDMLLPLEGRQAGNASYDYLLGVALLDAGYPGRASLVLERVALSQPDFAGARLELARAYYELGEYGSAEDEFDGLLKLQPPADVRVIIMRYLDAINRESSRYQTQLGGYVQLGSGYDSNANSAADEGEFLGFQLAEQNREVDSGFFSTAVGITINKPLARDINSAVGSKLQWQNRLDVSHRSNFSAHFVDQSAVSLSSGLAWTAISKDGQNSYGSIGLRFGHAELDSAFNYRSAGLQALHATQVDVNEFWVTKAQISALRFADDINVRDVNRGVLSMGKDWTSLGRHRLQLTMHGLLGRDQAEELNSPYSRWLYGASADVLVPGGGYANYRLAATVLRSDYRQAFFGFNRDDTYYSVTTSVEMPNLLARGLDVQTTLAYRNNDSSLDLYAYDGWLAGVFLTYRVQ